nr:RNA-directed DNA polymerase, eukaryota, reverse transcriptase zinc-binding domain protein [Tanacetum cinerariifolium]
MVFIGSSIKGLAIVHLLDKLHTLKSFYELQLNGTRLHKNAVVCILGLKAYNEEKSEGILGDGRNIRFWVDRWVDHRRLRDRFPRLFHLKKSKEGSVIDKGSWVLQNVVVFNTCRDRWRWAFDVKGGFKVKTLMGLIEQNIIRMGGDGQDTLWNKLVPKKVNVFVWRARKGRLPVREELNKRGIDLDSLLCALCKDIRTLGSPNMQFWTSRRRT